MRDKSIAGLIIELVANCVDPAGGFMGEKLFTEDGAYSPVLRERRNDDDGLLQVTRAAN
jgi:hypothetical protein